ncbi:spore coat protein [Paenibacillus sambharensis]|uniref:Spore coat protein n=1 Tax=Paenibacillus sambharensis TaxID=1803190 RepID=A0A2W1LQ69_9BACL|nr:spore coat protein [Paenibacillus sambharensis]PZD96664.1 spore coat protein [Paenibacillus sambharensis]
MRTWASHEFLATNELMRKITTDIELHALFASMTSDRDMQDMLYRHIQSMNSTLQRAVSVLQNRGMDMSRLSMYQPQAQYRPHTGFQDPHMIPAPVMNMESPSRVNDITISTAILLTHKAGSVFGMMWATECVDPELRALHVMAANNCQQMAYEIWQLMNARGYYEVPSMPMNDIQQMSQTFQPMAAGMGITATTGGMGGSYTGVRHMI